MHEIHVSIRPGPRTDPERLSRVLSRMLELNYTINLDVVGGRYINRKRIVTMLRHLRSSRVSTVFVSKRLC